MKQDFTKEFFSQEIRDLVKDVENFKEKKENLTDAVKFLFLSSSKNN